MDALSAWGWDEDWSGFRDDDRGEPARVIGQERDRWTVRTASRATLARVTAAERSDLRPVVGDWILVAPGPTESDPVSIVSLLPRRTAVVRGSAGDGAREHVLAANVGRVWVVHGLDVPPNLRRIERYLAVAWESGAVPSIVLTKSDLAEDPEGATVEVAAVAPGVAVETVSSFDPDSVERLRSRLDPGRTVVLLGPSGAGKSTLVNLLAGSSVASTAEVRSGDRKGRHTTTRRELFRIGGGALVIDTPGLRELRVRELDEGLDRVYPDIEALALRCRFRDCMHDAEPGCAVLAAVDQGQLDAGRLESYRKLQAEAAYERRKADPMARKAALSEHKSALKTLRYHPKYRDER